MSRTRRATALFLLTIATASVALPPYSDAQNQTSGHVPSPSQEKSKSVQVIYRSPSPGIARAPADSKITLDVFWCSGDGLASKRAAIASELANSYATIVRDDRSNAIWSVHEIRTRPIDRSVFLTNLRPNERELVQDQALLRFDSGDATLKVFADEVVGNSSRTIRSSSSRPLKSILELPVSEEVFAPNYVSVYVCADLNVATPMGRVFLQVKEDGQVAHALNVASAIREKFPGVDVSSVVEVVGGQAPIVSELRYFFDDDSALATAIAAEISTTGSIVMVTRKIEGFENKVRRGTVEAWLSDPPSVQQQRREELFIPNVLQNFKRGTISFLDPEQRSLTLVWEDLGRIRLTAADVVTNFASLRPGQIVDVHWYDYVDFLIAKKTPASVASGRAMMAKGARLQGILDAQQPIKLWTMDGMVTKVDLATNTIFLINASGGEPNKPAADSGEVIQLPTVVTDAGKAALRTLQPGDQVTTVFSQQTAIKATIIR